MIFWQKSAGRTLDTPELMQFCFCLAGCMKPKTWSTQNTWIKQDFKKGQDPHQDFFDEELSSSAVKLHFSSSGSSLLKNAEFCLMCT